MKVGNVRCIIKNKGKILLCFYKKGNHYFLPGGGIEFQELAEDAIYREFNEEMGLDRDSIKIDSFQGVIENMYADRHSLELVFNVSLKESAIESQEAYKIDFYWKDISEIDDLDIRPVNVKKMIKDRNVNHITNVDLDRVIV